MAYLVENVSLAGAWVGPEQRGAAVSTVTTVAYVGFLVGPAAVGLAASLMSLPTALTGVALVAVLLAVSAPTVSWATRWRRVHPR